VEEKKGNTLLAHTARDSLFVFQAGIIQKQGEGNAMQKDVNEIFITIRGKKRQIKSISKISPDIIKRAVSPYLDVESVCVDWGKEYQTD